MLGVTLQQLLYLLARLAQWVNHFSVLVALLDLVFLGVLVLLLLLGQVILKLLNDVQVRIGDFLVVLFDGGVLACVLRC